MDTRETASLEEGRNRAEKDLFQSAVGPSGKDPFDDSTEENRRLVWKQDLRIVPFAAFIYLLCYLDRSNIGNAKIMNSETHNDLKTELKITEHKYVIALMVFLVAYMLFEVPSNYFLKKLTPSKWIGFLMMSWGAITIGMGGVTNFGSLIATRFLLGMVEAGLFPGLVYYLTFWYRQNERSVRVAFILASATLAGAFGGAIAYGISHMNQLSGQSGWRWLFILEGIPSCISAIAVWFLLPDYPETAKWLTSKDKELAIQRLAYNGSRGSSASITWPEAVACLKDYRLWAHYLIYFCVSVSFSSLSLFSPSIIKGLGYSSLRAQLMTIPPWACAYVCTILVSYASDRFNARAIFSASSMIIGAAGFLASAVLPADAFPRRYGCLIVACSGAFASIPPLLGWISTNLHSTSVAGLAIALNVSWGAPGQIVGVWVYKDDEQKRGYPTGHYTNVAMLLTGAVAVIGLRIWYGRQNRKIARMEMNQPLWTL